MSSRVLTALPCVHAWSCVSWNLATRDPKPRLAWRSVFSPRYQVCIQSICTPKHHVALQTVIIWMPGPEQSSHSREPLSLVPPCIATSTLTFYLHTRCLFCMTRLSGRTSTIPYTFIITCFSVERTCCDSLKYKTVKAPSFSVSSVRTISRWW